ncbi:hypothetical protein BIFDEN_02279 [Bifidobacterium dentium ATCC 27678]|nr:hypothetical protein BIFDEN_02279 [Bifidobacterium dentium ATCC 27678]
MAGPSCTQHVRQGHHRHLRGHGWCRCVGRLLPVVCEQRELHRHRSASRFGATPTDPTSESNMM